MPYVKKEDRTREVYYNPKTAGQLNWAVTLRLVKSLHRSPYQGYEKLLRLKSIIEEILQCIVIQLKIENIDYPMFTDDEYGLMLEIDALVWMYMTKTNDSTVAKQVLRDVVHEFNRQYTDKYEDTKIVENGPVILQDITWEK